MWSLLCMLMISFGIKGNLSKKFEMVDLGEIWGYKWIAFDKAKQYIYQTKVNDHIESIYMHFGIIEKEWIKTPFTYQL
jgi:hypothetical protein